MLRKFVSRQFVRWTLRFRWKIWGFTLKKIKVRSPPPCRRTPKKKNLKTIIHDDWYQFHCCTIICIEINRSVFFPTVPIILEQEIFFWAPEKFMLFCITKSWTEKIALQKLKYRFVVRAMNRARDHSISRRTLCHLNCLETTAWNEHIPHNDMLKRVIHRAQHVADSKDERENHGR